MWAFTGRGRTIAAPAYLLALQDIQRVQPQMTWLEAIRDVMPEDGILCDERSEEHTSESSHT